MNKNKSKLPFVLFYLSILIKHESDGMLLRIGDLFDKKQTETKSSGIHLTISDALFEESSNNRIFSSSNYDDELENEYENINHPLNRSFRKNNFFSTLRTRDIFEDAININFDNPDEHEATYPSLAEVGEMFIDPRKEWDENDVSIFGRIACILKIFRKNKQRSRFDYSTLDEYLREIEQQYRKELEAIWKDSEVQMRIYEIDEVIDEGEKLLEIIRDPYLRTLEFASENGENYLEERFGQESEKFRRRLENIEVIAARQYTDIVNLISEKTPQLAEKWLLPFWDLK